MCMECAVWHREKKWCIYIAPFPYEYGQRRFTMISGHPVDRKHMEDPQADDSKWSMYAGTHFTDPGRTES